MGRFGRLTCAFYNPGNPSTSLTDTNGNRHIYPLSADSTAGGTLNANGSATVRAPYSEHWSDLITRGNICVMYYTDTMLIADFPFDFPFGGPFIIETVQPETDFIEFSGPCLLEELKQQEPVFHPVGAEVVTNTTIDTAVTGPTTTTVGVGAPINNDSITLATTSGWNEGDEVRVELNNGGTHVTVVTSVNPPGATPDTIQIRDRMPDGADIGNDVERRPRKIIVASDAAEFQQGVEVHIELDDASTFVTLIDDDPDGDTITIRDGLPDSADAGNSIAARDFSDPATDDVEQIMAYAGPWNASYDNPAYTGTEMGTYHSPDGDTVYDLLRDTANQTGETFRLDVSIVPGVFIRGIEWERAPYSTYGTNRTLVMPASFSAAETSAANANHLILTAPNGLIRRWTHTRLSRIYPVSGDERVTLSAISSDDALEIALAGYTLVNDPDVIGLYGRPYIKYAPFETDPGIGIRGAVVTFSHIKSETNRIPQIQAATKALVNEALRYLQSHSTSRTYYDALQVIGAPVYPNTPVDITYTDPLGWSVAAVAYVVAVNWTYDAQDGPAIPFMNLTLSSAPGEEDSAADAVGRSIRSSERYLARNSGGGTGGGTTTIVSTVGGTGGDHGTLTGLTDDDHTQYLRTDGGRTLVGNMAVGDGYTIDGVDLSAHVSNPSAHHAPVTVGSSALSVTSQMVDLVLKTDSGLQVSSGVGVRLPSASGLQADANGLSIDLAGNSGLSLIADGLGMGTPGTLSASTTNLISGTAHYHGILAYSDSRTNYGALLKSDAEGGLTIRRMAIGTPTETTATAVIKSFAVDDYTLHLKQLAGQTADVWRVESSAGAALIRLTGSGDLESGNPGFTSGLTGWQIAATGDAEFNNVFIRGELHATTFVADEMHATGGTMAVMTAAKVAPPVFGTDNVIPALGGTFFLNVQASYDTGLCYFAANDLIRIKPMGEIVSGGSLDLYDLYIQVSSTGTLAGRNLADGNPGYYRMTCIFRRGGTLGGSTGNATGFVIPAGCAAVRWTKLSQSSGSYTGGVILTSDLNNSPYIDVFTIDSSKSGAQWQSALVNPTPRVRVGNLAGVLGKSSDEWGIAAGTDLSDTAVTARYLVASDKGLDLRNVDLQMYSGGERIIRLSTDGMTLLTGTSVYEPDKSIRWLNSGGTVVGALSVRNSAASTQYYMELGLRPTFSDVLSDVGIRIYDNFTGDTFIDLRADEVQVSGGLIANTGMSTSGDFTAVGNVEIGAGLTIGSTTGALPAAGIMRFKERTGGAGVPPAGFSDLFVVDDGTRQILYARFENGALRELARG